MFDLRYHGEDDRVAFKIVLTEAHHTWPRCRTARYACIIYHDTPEFCD